MNNAEDDGPQWAGDRRPQGLIEWLMWGCIVYFCVVLVVGILLLLVALAFIPWMLVVQPK